MNEKNIHAFITYLQSQHTTQQFLLRCYEQIERPDAELKSYENCNSFLYYLNHGKEFYENGKKLPVTLQPLLFFYGMVHLLKACLLTKRPDYPESTKILAHGVSARKRKKKQYTFMDDEVKIQHNGLFPYFAKYLFHIDLLPTEKMNMDNLFSLIPEMASLYAFQKEEKLIHVGKIRSNILTFPKNLVDNYHLTDKMFIQKISPYLPSVNNISILKKHIEIEVSEPLLASTVSFFFNLENESIYFPKERDYFFPISEIMIHYLLLYNLSMLSRYESEWWGDMISTKVDNDYPFIIHFLNHTATKIPLLLGQLLYQEYKKHR